MTASLMDAYLAEVQALWPAGEPRIEAGNGTGRHVLIALPNARSPRLLVPAGNPVAASRAMLRFSSALDAKDTVKRIGVAGALRTLARRSFSDRIVTGGLEGSLTEYLAEVLGQPVDVSLGIGTARANRKPVLQVFDLDGRSLAFVKVGSTPVAEPHVAAEGEGLRRIGEAALPAHFEVPELLHTGRYDGQLVVAMSALDTWCWQRPSRMWDLPVDDMSAFARAFGDGHRPLLETDLWTRLQKTQQSLTDSHAKSVLGRVLDALGPQAGDMELEVGGWHGDWTPWNMSRRQGRLQLWDFERFETGVPLGLDRYHYAVNAVLRRDGVSPESVHEGLALAASAGTGDAKQERLLAAIYLTAISARYFEQAESGLGDTVQVRLQAIMSTLERWLHIDGGRA